MATGKRTKRKSSSAKPRKSRKSIHVPRTAKMESRPVSRPREHFDRASSSMSLTQLQFMAKSRGIPFGGLSKAKLVRKINNYY